MSWPLALLLALSACRNDDTGDSADTGTVLGTTDSVVETGTPTDSAPVDADQDGVTAAEDCDDTDPAVFPGAHELCNGFDDDCDGLVDDADPDLVDPTTWWLDADADGHGGDAFSQDACEAPSGFSATSDDCDDDDPSVHPGAEETDCTDPVDYNCDGSTGYADVDGDGHPACTECDDSAAEVNPEATETCNHVDDDCDGLTDDDDPSIEGQSTFYTDSDADGFGDPAAAVLACFEPDAAVADATDCDDTSAAVNPDATETCNTVDDDCDGLVDDDDPDVTGTTTWYVDGDGDGVGWHGVSVEACEAPANHVASSGDCDDGDASAYPGGTETCDGGDQDCDGTVDEGATDAPTWYADSDGDGYGDPTTSVTDCEAPSGHVSSSSDCDDSDPTAHPGGEELCDGADDDCDFIVDEDAADAPSWYADIDGDGHGDASSSVASCSAPSGHVAAADDCDDSDAAISPSAAEVCNGVDDDCNGWTDDDDPGVTDATVYYLDHDGDGYGDPDHAVAACSVPSGYVSDATDCDDLSVTTHPGAHDPCDGVDDNCSGDESDASGGTTWYADADGDGAGDASVFTESCIAPSGYVADSSDCDDTDASVTTCWASCRDILDAGGSSGDGVYSLDPCGDGTTSDFYCDMTYDGGGWTVAGWQDSAATTSLGLSVRNGAGDSDFSVDLSCVPYDEIGVFNQLDGTWFTQTYTPDTWAETTTNLVIGSAGDAFKHGTYGPSDSQIMMGCVDYTYGGGTYVEYACDSDGTASAKGHLADYAGEYCSGARLDYTWAWSDGASCSYRGTSYTWGYALR